MFNEDGSYNYDELDAFLKTDCMTAGNSTRKIIWFMWMTLKDLDSERINRKYMDACSSHGLQVYNSEFFRNIQSVPGGELCHENKG